MGSDTGETTIPADVEETLCRDPEIEFVVVFGSQVAGNSDRSSDLDVAVKFSPTLSADERFRKRCRLSGQLQSDAAPFVDLSDIENLSLQFARAAVEGEFLCGDRAAFRAYKETVEAEFERKKAEIEQQQREVIRRISEEGLRG